MQTGKFSSNGAHHSQQHKPIAVAQLPASSAVGNRLQENIKAHRRNPCAPDLAKLVEVAGQGSHVEETRRPARQAQTRYKRRQALSLVALALPLPFSAVGASRADAQEGPCSGKCVSLLGDGVGEQPCDSSATGDGEWGASFAEVAPFGELQESFPFDDEDGRTYYFARVMFGGSTAGPFGSAMELRSITVSQGMQYTLRVTTSRHNYLNSAELRKRLRYVCNSMRVAANVPAVPSALGLTAVV
eukprot:gene15453-21537_t